ncbi:MAG: tetratricopeptide repeat protein [Candidatus Promineifilaceae bacterium]|nr:tetratricopeptide repeat protein [Candidatus Promineifilaceae bacterium]
MPDFEAGEQKLRAIARLCDAVGRLPLAVELAAAGGAGLAPEEALSRLANSLDPLAQAPRDAAQRHASIYAAFDHSWQRLRAGHRRLFAALSVFPSSFARPAAAAVAGPAGASDQDSRRGLALLVRRSLLAQQTEGGRYGWHSLLRTYAAEKLAAWPDLARQVRQRQAAFYADWVAELLEQEGIGQPFLEDVRHEIENIRQAWQTGVDDSDHQLLGRLTAGVANYYQSRDRPGEGARLLEAAINALDRSPTEMTAERRLVLGRLLIWSSSLNWHGRVDKHLRPVERAVAHLVRLDAPVDYAAALIFWASSYRACARVDEAIGDAEQAITLLEARAEPVLLRWALQLAGECYFMRGDVVRAAELARRALSLYEAHGPDGRIVLLFRDLGRYALAQKRFEQAESWFEEAVATARRQRRPRRLGHATTDLLHLFLARQEFELARRRLEAVVEELDDHLRRFPDVQIDLLVAAGFLAHLQAAPDEVRACAYWALTLSRGLSHTVRGAHLLALVGRLLLAERLSLAAEILSFVAAKPVGLPSVAADVPELLAQLRERLTPQVFEAAQQQARRWHIDEVVALALIELKHWENGALVRVR